MKKFFVLIAGRGGSAPGRHVLAWVAETTSQKQIPDGGTAQEGAGQRCEASAPYSNRSGDERFMAKKVTCPLCGTDITGDTEDALVTAADAHGDENHGMRAPREMIVSSAVDV